MTFVLKFYLSLEKQMILQRSVCTVEISGHQLEVREVRKVGDRWFRSWAEHVKGSGLVNPSCSSVLAVTAVQQVRRLCKHLHFLLPASIPKGKICTEVDH